MSLLVSGNEPLVLEKFNDTFTLDQLTEAFRIFEEIIENLGDEGIRELCGGYSSDIEHIYSVILEEVLTVLYGSNTNLTNRLGYLDHLTKTVEETLCIENLAYFTLAKIPSFLINWHHLEWADMIQRYDKLCCIASRDSGKSFFFSNAYIAWKLYRYKPYTSPRVSRKDLALSKKGYLFSFSQTQAVDLLEILKSTIEENDDLRERLLPKGTDGWGRTEIRCKNGTSVKTKGLGGSVRGAHPGWIVVDDGLKDNVMYSADQRNKSISYFHSVIMNMIVPGGQVPVVGTPFHSADLYGDLKTKRGWHVREYPGIFPDGTVLWRERWGLEGLMEKRANQGNLIFSREILCKPVTNESSIFPMHVIQRSYVGMQDYTFVRSKDAYKQKFDRIVMSCDFSISANVGADYSVFFVAGIDSNEVIWLMHMTRFKGKTFSEQIGTIKSLNHSFQPDIIVMENNVFQQIFVQESDKLGMPVIGHTTTASSKNNLEFGLPGLALLYERGKMRCPRGNQESIDIADTIENELSSVTWTDKGIQGTSEHDDCAMSLFLLSIAARKATTGFSFKFL